MAEKPLYRLTPGDEAIFQAAQTDPDAFTDWYLRSKGSGSWIHPVDYKPSSNYSSELNRVIEQRTAVYERLFVTWQKAGKPKDVLVFEDEVYRVIYRGDRPSFFLNHGIRLTNVQREIRLATQETIIVIGGFGATKTAGGVIDEMMNAAMLPGYRGFAVAPYSLQAAEFFKKLKDFIRGTTYAKRFVKAIYKKPYPTIVIANDYVGENTIECFSIMDDPEKLKTLEGDQIVIDQAEKLEGYDEIIAVLSSRLRGIDPVSGRERLGKTIWMANSNSNYELWDLAARAKTDPENYAFFQPSTYDNPSISIKQLIRFERDFAHNEESRAVYMLGHMPMGNGEYFPMSVLKLVRSQALDDLMTKARNEFHEKLEQAQDEAHRLKLERIYYTYKEARNVGVVEWSLPPEPGHNYLVIADPGMDNPPERNSPVIGCWDITNFPREPMTMRGFWWVYGNGSSLPWLTKFKYVVETYNAQLSCGFDATGWQEGNYAPEFTFEEDGIAPTMIKLTEPVKMTYLNFANTIMSKGLVKMPFIPMAFSQMTNYTLPDKNIRQDIVMMIIMSCGYVKPLYFLHFNPTPNETKHEIPHRHYRSKGSRVKVHSRVRNR